VVQRYSRLAFLRSQAAKTIENSTFLIQYFTLSVYIPGVTQKKRGAAAVKRRLPRPCAFRPVFAPFPRVLIKPSPVVQTTLPPCLSPRTGGIFRENRTFSIQFFSCSRISGIERQSRGKTVYTRGGTSGKARYTAAARFRQ